MALHVSFLLILTALTGIHSITTVREVSVKTGGSVSIPCRYESQYRRNVKYLCVGYLWASCSYAVKTNQTNSTGKFSISDDKSRKIFTVTLNDVTDRDSGHYWCIVEIIDGSDYGERFHLSVTSSGPSLYVDHQEVTGTIGGNITISCHFSNSGEMKWCKLGSFCVKWPSGSIYGTNVTINASVPDVFTVTMSGLRTESSGWYHCVKGDLQMPVHVTLNKQPVTTTRLLSNFSPTPEPLNLNRVFTDGSLVEDGKGSAQVDLKLYIIPLSLLVIIVMVSLFIWLILKRQKDEADPSVTTTAEGEVTYSSVQTKRKKSGQAEEEVTYSNVNHTRKTDQRSDVKSDTDVLYTSVVTAEQQQRVEAKDDCVTYSMLTQHQQNL